MSLRSGCADVARLRSGCGSRPNGGDRSPSRWTTAVAALGTVAEVARLVSFRRPSAALVDAALAVVSFVVLTTSSALVATQPGVNEQTVAGVGLLAVQSAALLWRSRQPLLALMVSGVAVAAYGVAPLPDPVAPVGALIALGTYVAVAPRRQALVVTLLAIVGTVVFTAAPRDSDGLDYFVNLAFVVFAVLLGELVRTRRDYLREVEARLARLEAERETEARRAVADERTRIARELHDVVAHHVSMMVVQSEAAATSAADPKAFDAVASTGREALTELRRLVTVLREDGSRAPAAPQPGVGDLAQLAEQVRAAGLPVDVTVEGEPRPLPAGVDLSAYRIVQEALTNTIKHAGPARAHVVVRWCPDAVEVSVVDDGVGVGANGPPTTGHGLVGISERVALFGGSLQCGPAPGGGFAVAARLPT